MSIQITNNINLLELIATLIGAAGVLIGLYATGEIWRDLKVQWAERQPDDPRVLLSKASLVLAICLTVVLLMFTGVGLSTMATENRVPMSLQSFIISTCLVIGEAAAVFGFGYKTFMRRRVLLGDIRQSREQREMERLQAAETERVRVIDMKPDSTLIVVTEAQTEATENQTRATEAQTAATQEQTDLLRGEAEG